MSTRLDSLLDPARRTEAARWDAQTAAPAAMPHWPFAALEPIQLRNHLRQRSTLQAREQARRAGR